ncbi:hypothetical protein VR45_09960 [Streptomyces sp. NRRL S-495]|nr:hypothetical protein VR45_09960 [Streptomyces sp. NRRL S-495]
MTTASPWIRIAPWWARGVSAGSSVQRSRGPTHSQSTPAAVIHSIRGRRLSVRSARSTRVKSVDRYPTSAAVRPNSPRNSG